MEKKFKRKETDQPLTDLGKPTKKNRRPELDAETINEQRREKE